MTQHMDQDALSTVPGERIIDKPDIPACPAETLITQQVTLTSYVDLNGEPLDIEGMTATRDIA